MLQLNRILLATDFSDCAAEAQKFAVSLAIQFGAELHVLHVIQEPGPTAQIGLQIALPNYAQDLPQKMLEAEQQYATEQLQKLIPPSSGLEKPPVLVVRRGKPFQQITQYAEEQQIDLIVMGTHGRGMVAHVLLGSVAENVVRLAKCPVLTVRTGASRPTST